MKVKVHRGLYFRYYLTTDHYEERYYNAAFFICEFSRDAKECFMCAAKVLSCEDIPNDIDSERHRYTLIKWDSEEVISKL